VQNADAIITPHGAQLGVRYPKATAAQAALPFLLWYGLHGQYGGPRVHVPFTVLTGRVISVGYGVATILVVFLVGVDALRDRRAAVFAAWLLALGGLHVTQSHFFLADVPAAFWTILAAWLLWRDVRADQLGPSTPLYLAAFAAGAAVAFKLFVFALPALVFVAVRRPPRWRRLTLAGTVLAIGVLLPSLGQDSPASLYRVAAVGVSYPFEFSRLRAAEIFAVQAPAILSAPLLVSAAAGTVLLLRRVARADRRTRLDALAVFGSIPLVAALLILFGLDPFARHWVVLIPWAAIAGGYALSRAPAIVVAPAFVWTLAFVVDAERFFIFEPRNDALRWIQANVPPGASLNWVGQRTPSGFTGVRWMVEGTPDVLVFEMYEANNSLSGVDWRDSYPSDVRHVFDGHSAERVAAIQALFRGTSRDYSAAARFPPRYLMPEYRLEEALVGDRARNFISEVVVFTREGGH
jgi:hypothetical protein